MGQHDVLRIGFGLLGYSLILFENQIETTSASPCRTQVQPAASFLVCSLIFIEYKEHALASLILVRITSLYLKH